MSRTLQRTSSTTVGDWPFLDESTWSTLWDLFLAICERWQNVPDPELLKSDLITFVKNRVEMDANYTEDYASAARVIRDLVADRGREAAYTYLLTDAGANLKPPTTRLARARQRVANEFILLQLSLGGFGAFGGALNYPGYIAGANLPGHTPYRTYQDPA